MVESHTSSFGTAELGEDGADGDIFDARGVEVGVFAEGGLEDLGIVFSLHVWGSGREAHGCEHLLWVGISEAAFIGAGYGGSKGGEEDDVIGVLLEGVLEPFLCVSHSK